jgi:hypothetical protein
VKGRGQRGRGLEARRCARRQQGWRLLPAAPWPRPAPRCYPSARRARAAAARPRRDPTPPQLRLRGVAPLTSCRATRACRCPAGRCRRCAPRARRALAAWLRERGGGTGGAGSGGCRAGGAGAAAAAAAAGARRDGRARDAPAAPPRARPGTPPKVSRPHEALAARRGARATPSPAPEPVAAGPRPGGLHCPATRAYLPRGGKRRARRPPRARRAAGRRPMGGGGRG